MIDIDIDTILESCDDSQQLFFLDCLEEGMSKEEALQRLLELTD